MIALPKQLKAYLTFILTYRRFLICKLPQFLEESQFFPVRFRMVAPLCIIYTLLLFLRNRRHENQSFIKVATYFNLINTLPKQVEAYRNFILTKRRFLICRLKQVILRIWRNCHSFQRVNAAI